MPALRTRALVVSLLFFLNLGCGSEGKSSSSIFPQDSVKCASSAIPNQFIVHWLNGESELYKGLSREELLTQVVEPHLHEIRRVDYNRKLELPEAPLATQAIGSQWGVVESHAPEAWARNIRGAGAVVAVIDSGIDYNHSQLKNQIYYNVNESGLDKNGQDKRYNSIDDDNNGYVDDYYGFNFAYNDGNPDDSGMHGTHVSGIIAAQHSDHHPVQGVAPDAKIVPIAFIGADDFGDINAAIRAMDYAAIRGAHIVNASWGGVACAPSLGEKIRDLGRKGIIFVSASGNSGLNIEQRIEFPASFNEALQVTVGSIGRALGMADHSNFGSVSVHLFAPGVEVLSTLPGNIYGSMTGTSMATPFVAGALALLKSHRPQATAQQLRTALFEGVDTHFSYVNATGGRLNIEKAILALEGLVPASINSQPL